MKCSTNNKASTVYDLFLQAVQHYGLPSRVRCDQGRENIRVAHHMIHHRGIERRSVLVGSSVHNQRIERLWKDMHRCVTAMFYRLFYYLEYHSLLDPISDTHLFALHYIYLPRINRSLQQFQQAWNNHRIRTERGLTPNQLFTAGALQLRNSGLVALDFFVNIPEDYGAEEGVLDDDDDDDDDNGVLIPATRVQLSDEHLSELRESINPLGDSDDFGIDLYQQVLAYVQPILQSEPTE